MPFVNDLHYVSYGPATGETGTIVLLHGFQLDHRALTGSCEPVFATRPGWRRIYLDLPGMGRSTAPDAVHSTDDVFAAVQNAVRTLIPDGPYAVCGQSYGGYLARGLVAADPGRVTGMALIVPMIIATHASRDVDPHVVLHRDAFAAALPAGADFDQEMVVQTEETYRRIQAEEAPGLALADPGAVARLQAAYPGTFPLEPAPFNGPSLFLLGRQDSVTGYRDAWHLLADYPRATFAVLDRAGHGAQIEQPSLFTALLTDWLDRIATPH
ncbi:alpha/beta fold hydrolase [Catenuloplanes sp. NPDC051500]|uniref:alpha/beta fold hydrolase n=1 Tax=Catenuloplanes sp. NPDC051500 TaxID=3363959 RepID=UPI0037B3FA7C